MGRLSKEAQWRNEGMVWAYRYLAEGGHSVDELALEIRARGIYSIPLNATRKDVQKLRQDVTEDIGARIIRFMYAVACDALVKEFDFGNRGDNGRLKRFIARMRSTCDTLNHNADGVNFEELYETLNKEYNLGL